MSSIVFDLIDIGTNRKRHASKPDLAKFSHLRGFHFGRPEDPQSYRVNGIRIGERSALDQTFRGLFSDFPRSQVDEAFRGQVSQMVPDYIERDPGVFLGLDYRFLLRRGNHYASYGSERVQKLAGTLGALSGKIAWHG